MAITTRDGRPYTNVGWTVIAGEDTNDHRLLLEGEHRLWAARVRSDGCVDLTRWFNGRTDEDDADTIHLCDVRETIARLEALLAAATDHFGEGWE